MNGLIEKDIAKKRTIKANKSLHFLLPMLRISYNFYRNNIINSYILDRNNRPKITNYHIFLLLKQRDEKLENMDLYIENYPVDEGLMYVFKIPVEFQIDYLKYILGQYSEFSPEYKEQIIRLLPVPYEASNVFKVIMKSPDAKKLIEEKVGQSIGNQEVMSIPCFEEECYE